MMLRRGGPRVGAAREGNLRVLVVDDSAVIREAMRRVLARERDIEVASAADPIIALEKIARHRPDVIVLDLEMPRMDGLTFLRRLMSTDPIPVVVFSGAVTSDSEAALQATEEGAVAIVPRPRFGAGRFVEDIAVMLIDGVRAAAEARLRPRIPLAVPAPVLTADAVLRRVAGPAPRVRGMPVVAIGASTGGTEALRFLLESLPASTPPLLIVQHMPEQFTAAFARRLAKGSRLAVKEAEPGDPVEPGVALIAPGNRHLLLARDGARLIARLSDGPLVSRHRPSVDVLFRSVATQAGAEAVGVIMTGMGADGAEGLLELRAAGARTLAQDEQSCVVFGMPKEAARRGAVERMVPLVQLPDAILRAAATQTRLPAR